MKPVGFQDLFDILKRYRNRKEYLALKNSCLEEVTKWRWASGTMLPDFPYEKLRMGTSPTAWLTEKPNDKYGCLHGLDKNGRILCGRSDPLDVTDENTYEQFFDHKENGFWYVAFKNTTEKSVGSVWWYEVMDGKWLRSLNIHYYSVNEYVLHWTGSCFTGYEWRSCSDVTIDEPEPSTSKLESFGKSIYTYSYSDDGKLDRVTQERKWSDGTSSLEVQYQRVPKGVSLNSLLKEVEEHLVSEIPKIVRAAKVQEPVYALILQFTGVDTDPCFYFPPLFLPTEKLRRRVLPEDGNDGSYILWAVPEWETGSDHVALSDRNDTFEKRFQLVFQLTKQYGPVRKMFQRVCARLNEYDWKGVLETTDDFIVIPYDPHSELDFKVDLKACVPVEKLQLLMSRKYIERMKLK